MFTFKLLRRDGITGFILDIFYIMILVLTILRFILMS